MEVARSKIGFEGCMSVDSIGHSGEVAILWKDESKARLLNFVRSLSEKKIQTVAAVLDGIWFERNRRV
ncbi:hypothetical protein LINPERHAP1_LOCUS6059 [Linum perenne]